MKNKRAISPEAAESLRKFGKHLSMLRKNKRLSQRVLSYECNIDNSTISKIEQGKRNIYFTTMVQLANALQVPLSELTNFEEQ